MIKVYSQVFDEIKWESIKTKDIAGTAVDLVCNAHDIEEDKQVSIVFTNNIKVQELNKLYRKKDKPTNVLSFAFNDDGSNGDMLGEIFIAYDVINEEAIAQNKSFKDHLIHILIHGVLHLLGYDHIEDEEAEKMETLEIELLEKINIKNPYKKGCNN